MSTIPFKTASQLASAIRSQEISSYDVISALLSHIKENNGSINALVTINAEQARQQAKASDKRITDGKEIRPLEGVPFTIKDSYLSAGIRTTSAHAPLRNHLPAHDAQVITRLKKAGAIILGKTNLPQLCMDTQTDNKLFGKTNNPWNINHTAGGSAGGEAAAIASGMSPLGIGSDIGGSIRIPAHYCGLYSLKATHGRISNHGHIPPLPKKTNSIRHLMATGPIARSIEDLELCYSIIDEQQDPTQSQNKSTPVLKELSMYRFALSTDFGGLPITNETQTLMTQLATDLSDQGCAVTTINPPFDINEAWQVYGELFGLMAFLDFPLLAKILFKHIGRFMVKDIISKATTKRAIASMKTYFTLLDRQESVQHQLETSLTEYDAWLVPVSCTPAFKHRKAGKIHTPINVDGAMIPGNIASIGYTCPFNVTGHPVVTIPMGFSQEGLPIGLQVVGHLHQDHRLLATAQALTQMTGSFTPPPGYSKT